MDKEGEWDVHIGRGAEGGQQRGEGMIYIWQQAGVYFNACGGGATAAAASIILIQKKKAPPMCAPCLQEID